MSTTADDLVATFLARLAAAGATAPGGAVFLESAWTRESPRPTGIMLMDHPDLPLTPEELPAIAVYLMAGETPAAEGDDSVGNSQRQCELWVEIRRMAKTPVQATRLDREWILKTLYAEESLGGRALSILSEGWWPFGDAQGDWLAGALMKFTATYFWSPT